MFKHTPQSEEELQEAESQATGIAAAAAGSVPADSTSPAGAPAAPAGPVVVPVVIPAAPAGTAGTPAPAMVVSSEENQEPAAATPTADPLASAAIAATAPEGGQPFEQEAQRLAQIIRVANDELLQRAQAVLSPEMEAATQTYIEKLRTLADTFAKVDEQSARLAKDSEEMENLNRTLTGINKVYELHLKSISLQVGTIDQINDQTHKLANQIEELNAVYGRMIEALTVNMRGNKE